jgi:two-component system, OmpR family, sensor histidine kinase MprB
VTFRTRVISTTVAVAAIVVVLACAASYVTTRNALYKAVDESLIQTSTHSIQQVPNTENGLTTPGGDEDKRQVVFGSTVEIVLANGVEVPSSRLPIDAAIRAIAKGSGPQLLRTIVYNNQQFRELVVPIAANSLIPCPTGVCEISSTAAAIYVANTSGQEVELHRLIAHLILIAIIGLLLALLLGLILARRALHPLEDVTNQIEEVATTTNLGHRLEEDGEDELARLRRTFNRLLRSVENSQSLQRQLVMDASHELRTPLTSLRTNAQVLAKANELPRDEVATITSDMVTQVDELAALVTDLGELARGERSEGDVVTIPLDEVVEEVLDASRTYARIKNITITLTSDGGGIVTGRRDRLVRAISNLLTNAVKFTPDNGHIAVHVTEGILTVSDSGPGIAPEDRLHVFDRFWRSPSARALPGSGLGLSIVDQVVREFGGTCRVDEDPTLGGARFTLTIPTVSP